MDMESKSGAYPHPHPQQQGVGMPMPMPMPPSYEQTGYPPQQQGMYPPIHGAQHHIHYVPGPPTMIEPEPIRHQPQPTVIVTPQVGPDPTMVCCPSCRETVVSRMEYESSTRTHVAAGLLFLFGCWLCCCFPYCMDSCRNGNHYCPSCGAFLGTYRS